MFNKEFSNHSVGKQQRQFETVPTHHDVTKIEVVRQTTSNIDDDDDPLNNLPTLEAGTMHRTPIDDNFGKEAFTVIKDITNNNSPSKLNSYDGISTEKKSPSLKQKSRFACNSPGRPLSFSRPRHSNPQILSMLLKKNDNEIMMNDKAGQTLNLELERSMTLTP